MRYADGIDIKPGEVIQIDGDYCGRVIASMDTSEYLPGEDWWAYRGAGIMLNTDFAGLVHYTTGTDEDFVLIECGAAA